MKRKEGGGEERRQDHSGKTGLKMDLDINFWFTDCNLKTGKGDSYHLVQKTLKHIGVPSRSKDI